MEESVSMMLRISREGEIILWKVQLCLKRMAAKDSRNHIRRICPKKRTLIDRVLFTEWAR